MELTALIVSRGRAQWLKRCVASLEAAARSCSEIKLAVLIGVNGPDPETKASFGGAHQLEYDSPAGARNQLLGFVQPTTDWVLFIDDDAFVEPDYFKKFIALHAQHPQVSAIGGPNLTPPAASFFEKATGAALSSRFATFLSYARYRAVGKARPCNEEALILCNLFVKRSALERKPFPAHFKCAEENWLLQSLSARGERLLYAPELSVWHERRSTLGALAAQVYKYGYGRGQNIRSRPTSLKIAHVIPSLCIAYSLVAAVCVLFGASVLWLSGPVAAYLFMAMVAGVRALRLVKLELSAIAAVMALFIVIHVCYGLGVTLGMIES